MAKTDTRCMRCGSVFSAENKELNRGKAKFCGVSCANADRSAKRKNTESRKNWLAANKGTDRYIAQRKAHHAVEEAVNNGKLKRLNCEVCGSSNRVHAHHEDYEKPLDVKWLCVAHHRELHG